MPRRSGAASPAVLAEQSIRSRDPALRSHDDVRAWSRGREAVAGTEKCGGLFAQAVKGLLLDRVFTRLREPADRGGGSTPFDLVSSRIPGAGRNNRGLHERDVGRSIPLPVAPTTVRASPRSRCGHGPREGCLAGPTRRSSTVSSRPLPEQDDYTWPGSITRGRSPRALRAVPCIKGRARRRHDGTEFASTKSSPPPYNLYSSWNGWGGRL